MARAIDPGRISSPLGNAIRLFGELGFAALLADPARARDQCIEISTLFTGMCTHRGIPAETVDGYLLARIPPFTEEAVICGHTGVRAPGVAADGSSGIVIDWTARQFDPAAPVPLVVTIGDWRAFWRDLRRRH